MTERIVTITMTEEQVAQLYRACKSRSNHFALKALNDPEYASVDRLVQADYLSLANSIFEQTGIKG